MKTDECERGPKVRLGESEMQSGNFPSGLNGVRSPHEVFDDTGSCSGGEGDMVS